MSLTIIQTLRDNLATVLTEITGLNVYKDPEAETRVAYPAAVISQVSTRGSPVGLGMVSEATKRGEYKWVTVQVVVVTRTSEERDVYVDKVLDKLLRRKGDRSLKDIYGFLDFDHVGGSVYTAEEAKHTALTFNVKVMADYMA